MNLEPENQKAQVPHLNLLLNVHKPPKPQNGNFIPRFIIKVKDLGLYASGLPNGPELENGRSVNLRSWILSV